MFKLLFLKIYNLTVFLSARFLTDYIIKSICNLLIAFLSFLLATLVEINWEIETDKLILKHFVVISD